MGTGFDGWTREDLVREVERLHAEVSELKCQGPERDAAAELGDIPSRDALTGLFNRNAFFTLAVQQLRIATRFRQSIVLLACRADNVEHIARVAGLATANAALAEAARMTRECFRDADVVARVERDEFAVLAVQAARSSGSALIQRLQDRLARRRAGPPDDYELVMSVGQAWWDPDDPCSARDLLTQARTDRNASSP